MKRKILIMGLPGSGKTTLAEILTQKLNAVWFNADAVRQEINKDLGFTEEDRNEQARRMGKLCDWVKKSGNYAIADFVCPTKDTRTAFKADFTIWVDRIEEGRFADTNKLFEKPTHPDVILKGGSTPEEWTEEVLDVLFSSEKWNNKAPTSLLIGRYQPFHKAHKELVRECINRSGQCCIALRDVAGTDDSNPYDFKQVKDNIMSACTEFGDKVKVIEIPNIINFFYGRTVGYNIEQLELSKELQDISASKIRAGKIDKDGNSKNPKENREPGWRPE
jgi:adenylylsulfate kinase-like enzyme